ncbi:MAG: bifunctional diaminohydroxyphosphoribosylaminopyrimidine deaminase/5-amino-6-(5-phosphoribosylamino)uracil reductase RibD [Chloroflexota bacterium]
MSTQQERERYMKRALGLARLAEGFTSPNPMVGSVVVKNGRIIGEGYHHYAGAAHAEVVALENAGEAAEGATVYVSLEPCNHFGRTPPCTQALIDAKVEAVHYAISDPNPRAKGGHQRLEAAGIQVSVGLCEAEARHLNRFFFRHAQFGCPHVIAKFATSLDGKIATRTGHSQWITGTPARQRGHGLRQAVDAILVGAETAVLDNPQLTTRLPNGRPSHPLRIVLDSQGRVPLSARLFDPELPGQTLVATTAVMPAERRLALEGLGVWVWEMPVASSATDANGRSVNLPALLGKLGEHNIQSVLVEGGGTVLGSFFDEGLVHEAWAFLAPMIIGGSTAPSPVSGLGPATLSHAWRLDNVATEAVGQDVLVRGVVHYNG